MDYTQARLHNLLIRVYIYMTKHREALRMCLPKTILHDSLYFRQSDFVIINSNNSYFKKDGDNYHLSKEAIEKIEIYIEQHAKNLNVSSEIKEEFVRRCKSVFEEYRESLRMDHKEITSLVDLAVQLHWKFQPEYEEYMLVNSGKVPEDNLESYYDHNQMMEDLYNFLLDKGKNVKTYLGDINLGHEFKFNVHSNRWGHYDTYYITRSLEGWDVQFLMTGGKGDKEGSAIIRCLDHDNINYPQRIRYLFKALWEKADETEMSVETLCKKMQLIADWISQTEKGIPDNEILED